MTPPVKLSFRRLRIVGLSLPERTEVARLKEKRSCITISYNESLKEITRAALTMSNSDDNESVDSSTEEQIRQLLEGLPLYNWMQEQHDENFAEFRQWLSRQPRDNTVCKHFRNVTDDLDTFQIIHFYLKMCEEQPPELEYDAFVGYWVMKSGAYDLSSDCGATLLKSMAATALLHESDYKSYHDARMYLGIATKLDAVQNMGGDVVIFNQAVDYDRETLKEKGEDPALQEYYQAVLSICSNQGLVNYLADQSTCHCFDDLQSVQPTICDTCLEGYNNVLKCSQCKVAKYCSQACQKRDWPKHKRYCKKYLNLQERLEAIQQNG